jgi:hypothetical protein
MVKGSGGAEEPCIVAKLKDEKPMILNKTNCKIIAKIYGTPYIEDWGGFDVTIYAANVNAFGQTVEALRIETQKPKLPVLDTSNEKWEQAKTALKSGQITMQQLKKNYSLSQSNEKLILKSDD